MISVQRVREIRTNPVLFSGARREIRDPIDSDLVFRGRCQLSIGVANEVLERLKEEYEPYGWRVHLCPVGGYIEIRE